MTSFLSKSRLWNLSCATLTSWVRRMSVYFKQPSTKQLLWVFITGECSGWGVQWMGVVLYNELV